LTLLPADHVPDLKQASTILIESIALSLRLLHKQFSKILNWNSLCKDGDKRLKKEPQLSPKKVPAVLQT